MTYLSKRQWNNILIGILVIICFSVSASAADPMAINRQILLTGYTIFASTGEQQEFTNKEFKVYSAFLHRNQPTDLEKMGFWPQQRLMASTLWPIGSNRDEPNLHHIEWHVRRLDPNIPLWLDIEHWPLSGGNEQLVNEGIRKFITVASTIRKIQPELKFGFYAMPPVNVYFSPAQAKDSRFFRNWETGNAQLTPISEHVDFIFPSIYAHNDDQEEWQRVAIAKIQASREYGKPVYAFLWPFIKEKDDSGELRPKPVTNEFWHFQLMVCRQHADGVFIFGGWDVEQNTKQPWDSDAPWLLELRRFIANPSNSVTKPSGYEP